MLRRLLPLAIAVIAVLAVFRFLTPTLGAPSWWPDRGRDRNVRYFRDVLQTVKENYVDGSRADYDELTRGALRGLVSQLDPHSEFLTREEFAAAEEELSNQFDGVGLQVEQRDGRILVISAIPGTPAEAAGVRRGDQLVKVDGQALVNPTLDKAVRLIRGAPGTAVTLTLFRSSASRELDFTLTRQRILLHSVRNPARRTDGLGYLQITQFSEKTGAEFAAALAELEKAGLQALIIDLRNNPGGLLDAAIAVCGEFFDRNELIAYTQGRDPGSREDFRADGRPVPRRYPIAILVNGGTASAAEIVTGAMRDTGRAVIVGERTFGKGSVQSVIELPHGEGLRLTTARYYTPSGVALHEKGIAPDVELVLSADDEARISLQQSRSDREEEAAVVRHDGAPRLEDTQRLAAEEILTGLRALRPPARRSP